MSDKLAVAPFSPNFGSDLKEFKSATKRLNSDDIARRADDMEPIYSVTRKKLPNVYKSCPKMISPEK